MDIRVLRYFIACFENKTLHAAAEAVHVSQPALSKAIRNLESHLGVPLLDRLPRGVTPTPYGNTLYRYAKMIDSEMRRMVSEIEAMHGVTRGTIVIGVIPTMTRVLADVAKIVMDRHPGLHLELKIAFSSELIAPLLDGELDTALMLLPAGNVPPGLLFEPLVRSVPKVTVRSGHPLLDSPKLTMEELGKYPWLIPNFPTAHWEIVSRSFLDAGLTPPNGTIRVSTVVFFEAMLQRTDLVTITPTTLLNSWPTQLVPLDIDFPFPPEQEGLAYRENATLLPGARVVMDLVRSECSQLHMEGSPETATKLARK